MFFTLYMRDVRLTTWWVRYTAAPTSYAVAYNGNASMLDYDQTIYRWSTTALPVMFDRGRAIEKALLQSTPEFPRAAIIQPCASVFNLASMGEDHKTSPTIRMMFELHNSVLRPRDLAHDYVPEEMVLDQLATLDPYALLFLPYAPYMSGAFAAQLKQWVENGGTLVSIGPFALMDPFGARLGAETSLFRQLFPDFRRTGAGYFDYSLTGDAAADAPGISRTAAGRGTHVHLKRMSSVYTQNAALKAMFDKELTAFDTLRSASTASADLKVLVRTTGKSRDDQDADLYVCVCNLNVEEPVSAE
jgi:hypothetical protein